MDYELFDYDEHEDPKNALCSFVQEKKVRVVAIVPDKHMEDWYLFYEKD